MFDFIMAFIGIILLSPILITVSILIIILDGSPIFFRQLRVGYRFNNFKLIKFRTMYKDAERYGFSITSGRDSRITRIGTFLRKTKLDELPQLFNVLLGDMSLVGPRPEVPKYVEIFKKDYYIILKVKPGITDNAALEFIDEETFLSDFQDIEKIYICNVLPKKIMLYKRYISKMSFHYDLYLLLMTGYRLLFRALMFRRN